MILRELPRQRIAVVALVVVVNLGVVAYVRGCAIGRSRAISRLMFIPVGLGTRADRESAEHAGFVPPWNWTADEWRETVWPWR